MIKKGLTLVGCFIWLLGMNAYAQQKGEVEIVKDPLIAVLQKSRIGTNIGSSSRNTPVDKKNATRTTTKGFRVQIYSGSNRGEAYAEQARFIKLFRDIDTYVSYEEPNYRVKVGDFRSRNEAQSLMQSLRKQFNNVFVFTEEIYVYH